MCRFPYTQNFWKGVTLFTTGDKLMIDTLKGTTSKHAKCGLLVGRDQKIEWRTQKRMREVVGTDRLIIQNGERIVKTTQMIMFLCTLKNKLACCLKYVIIGNIISKQLNW